MQPHFRRNHLRNYHSIPINWKGSGSKVKNGRRARTVNLSSCGMCFETREKIAPGTEIAICLDEDIPQIPSVKRREPVKALVRWCHPTDDVCYGIGVQYLLAERNDA